jgi:hypothetical protein
VATKLAITTLKITKKVKILFLINLMGYLFHKSVLTTVND